jgi:23S rRNA pseudouridine2605 synthase
MTKKQVNRKYGRKSGFTGKNKITETQNSKMITTGVRLNKLIASAGICSRREADDLIKAGAISVNGKIVDQLGLKVMPHDDIRFNGKKIHPEKPVYILLNKPKDFITSVEDEKGRKTVMDLVRNACHERVFPVGRLDRNTTGIMLITNDGELATRLTHPKYNKMKIYHVQLDQALKKEDFKKIIEGFDLDDGFIKADMLSYIRADDKRHVGIEIHSGRNRIVKRIFEHLQYKVISLDRVYFAGLTKKGVPRGKWRFLKENEINMLKMGAYK